MTEDSEVDTKYSAVIGKVAPVLQAMAKQVILEQCGPEMKTYLIERQCYGMSLRLVQEHSASYQVAHVRQGDTARKPVKRSDPRPTASVRCLAISVTDAEKRLESMLKERRKAFLRQERPSWNCLKYGHVARHCQSSSKCIKCKRNHNLLIHDAWDGADDNREKPTEIVTDRKVGYSSVWLMTRVARVEGKTLTAKVRVFLDSGAQVKFCDCSIGVRNRCHMYSGKTTGLCPLDMSKAFDKVHHDKLIQDLLAVGISGKALSWFVDYFSGRKQQILISPSASPALTCTFGVPQGSVLGPQHPKIRAWLTMIGPL